MYPCCSRSLFFKSHSTHLAYDSFISIFKRDLYEQMLVYFDVFKLKKKGIYFQEKDKY